MEGDCRIRRFFLLCDISIHSLRMEGDVRWVAAPGRFGNISIHSLRMEGDLNTKTYIRSVGISIHSLRMEGDRFRRSSVKYDSISIHSLRMEGDIEEKKQFALGKAFQSTPSAWRETHIYLLLTFTTFYFNPLPPHGGRLIIRFFAYIVNSISIHSLRMEGDTSIALFDFGISISIHSLRMEGDFLPPTLRSAISISIHSLRMEGDIARFSEHFSIIPFQSTPSAWRETLPVFP